MERRQRRGNEGRAVRKRLRRGEEKAARKRLRGRGVNGEVARERL
jgi:hypothetical protein